MPAKIKTPEENPLYVQLNYEESLDGKKQMLYYQTSILKLLKNIQSYHILRTKELMKKQQLSVRLKQLKANLRTLETDFPKIRIPSSLKRDYLLEKISPEKKIEDKEIREIQIHNKAIENQLQEIQRKLRMLSK